MPDVLTVWSLAVLVIGGLLVRGHVHQVLADVGDCRAPAGLDRASTSASRHRARPRPRGRRLPIRRRRGIPDRARAGAPWRAVWWPGQWQNDLPAAELST